MITKNEVDLYIQKIPPASEVLRETISLLNQGELIKASQVAKNDLALCSYLKSLVNKPIYGFKNEVSDVSQIFGILGVSASKQTVYNYMMSLLSPKKWAMFKLNKSLFSNLQATLSANWIKILKNLDIKDTEIASAISLLPASIIVSDALFKDNMQNVELIRSASEIDLNTILKRLSGMDLFDICEQIAIKWEMSSSISELVKTASGLKQTNNKDIEKLAKYMHLLLFHTLSQPHYIEANLNDFIDFQIDFVEDIYEDFMQIMGIS